MTDASSIAWTADGELEVLTFGMGGETFALDASVVREILDLLPTTTVPGADPLIGHVVNFRGRVIPLADLRPAFGMEQAPATLDTRIVVIEIAISGEPVLVGLRTDKVDEVTTLRKVNCEDPPAIGLRWPRERIRGLVRRDTDIIVLPDIGSLFNALAAERAIH